MWFSDSDCVDLHLPFVVIKNDPTDVFNWNQWTLYLYEHKSYSSNIYLKIKAGIWPHGLVVQMGAGKSTLLSPY